MKIFFAISLCILSINIYAGILYQTGYETANEPFGNWKAQNDLTHETVTSLKAYSGKNSRTPGFGKGRYGRTFVHQFNPALKADKIWVSYQMFGEKVVTYLGFILIQGKSDNGTSINAVYNMSGKNYISIPLPKGSIKTKPLINAWHKYEYELDFKNQAYNLYIDGKLTAKNIVFYSKAKDNISVTNIDKIVFGGSGSKEKVVFYDDLYVGTTRQTDETAVKVLEIKDFNHLPLLKAGRTSTAPEIDGSLNDKCWQSASTFSPFSSPDGTGTLLKTEAFITYDKDNLYLGVRGYDKHLDPVLNKLDQVEKGTTGKDVSVWKSDSVEIFIATKSETPNEYFHLGFNLNGGSYDSHSVKGVKWQSKAISATGIYNSFWEMEIKIPLSELDIKDGLENSKWRFNICRNKKSGGKGSSWAPTFGSYHSYSKFGILEFNKTPLQIRIPDNDMLNFSEGENRLKFSVLSDKNQKLEFRNIISYENADTIACIYEDNAKANRKTTIQDRFFISVNTAKRKSSSNFNLSYEVRNAEGSIICRSAPYKVKLEKYSAFKSSFICTSSNVIFKYFSHLFINRDSTRSMLLLIQADPKILTDIKKVKFQIEMPAFMKLADLDSKDISSCRPEQVSDKILERKGKKYRRITMEIDRKWIYSMSPMGKEQPYSNWILLTFKCSPKAPLADNLTIEYNTSAKINGKDIIEKKRILKLSVLPIIKGGKVNKSLPVILCTGPWIRILNNMSYTERESFLENTVKSGCNFMGYDEHLMSDELLKQIRKHGLNPYYDIPINTPRSWRSMAFPGADEYLRKNPQYRAVSLDGKTHNDVICLTTVIQENSPYDLEMSKWLAPRAKAAEALFWDYEVPPARSKTICACPRCLKEFAKFIGNKSVKRDEIVKQYKSEWIDFQTRRIAKVSEKLYKLTKQINPDCKFWVYSGYQSQNTKNSYSIDWRYFKNAMDNAGCGYGRPLQAINDTMQAITPRKLISGLLMQVWWNTVYDYSRFRNSLFRRLTDGNGGVLFWSDMQIDGRFWSGVADMTRLIEANEEFFTNHQRDESLCEITGNSARNMAVLKNDKNERIIFVFNPVGKTNKCTINNFKIPAGAKLKDFLTGKTFSNPARADITVNAFDVKILTLKK
jgi:hypothetical protein